MLGSPMLAKLRVDAVIKYSILRRPRQIDRYMAGAVAEPMPQPGEALRRLRREAAEKGVCARLRRAGGHHSPVFGMEAQGSCGGRASPRWSSSMEMPSGERTNAMWPSLGGRLMVTPPSRRRWQSA